MFKSRISHFCLILSAITLGINTAPVFAQNTKKDQDIIAAKTFVNSVNSAEQTFYRETGKFTIDLNQFELMPANESYQYKLKSIDNGNLIQTTASPNEIRGFRTFTGAIAFNKEKFAFNTILCKSERVAKVIVGEIKLVNSQLQCPSGFILAFHDVYKETIDSVRGINRGEQASHFQTGGNFTKDTTSFGFTPSNTYYDYTIDLLENDQLAQVKAVAKFDSLRSYIGATYYEKNTGIYESIICISDRPTKNISQSIKLSNGKLSCPTGFKMTPIYIPQEGLNNVEAINRAQQAYHFDAGNFAKDITPLGLAISNINFNYEIDLLENSQLAQIKATPKLSNVNGYIGGLLFTYQTGLYQSIVCASEQPTTDISQSIKLVDSKLACPTGFKNTETFSPQEGLNGVGTINRSQHAYHFEAGNFTKDITQTGIIVSSNYFDFMIDILENGQLAQVKAIPKPANARGYIGGTLFTAKTGNYESIVCASEQATKDISQSIKVVDGKLACPTGFFPRN